MIIIKLSEICYLLSAVIENNEAIKLPRCHSRGLTHFLF